jgi:hypothetical protein
MTEPKTVRDIMNPTLLYVRDGDRMTLVRSRILQFGVTGVPVLDDLRVTAPVLSARDTEPLAKAARCSRRALSIAWWSSMVPALPWEWYRPSTSCAR